MMMTTSLGIFFLFTIGQAAAQVPSRLAVMPTQLDPSVEDQIPQLFDDYLLGAVQNHVDYDVIGPNDINALLSFEKQKEALGCDEVSCLTDIGLALGVERLLVVQLARVASGSLTPRDPSSRRSRLRAYAAKHSAQWILTAKVINIRDTRVESRVNDAIDGDVKNLLEAIPAFVAKTFASTTGSKIAPLEEPALQPPSSKHASHIGSQARIGGHIATWSGVALTVVGMGLAVNMFNDSDNNDKFIALSLINLAGLLATGIGSFYYRDGKAQAFGGDGDVEVVSSPLRVAAWIMAGAALAAPTILYVTKREDVSHPSALVLNAAASTMFLISMWGTPSHVAAPPSGPAVGIQIFRERNDRLVPGLSMAVRF